MVVKKISAEQAKEKLAHLDVQLIDIRDEDSFQAGHIAGALHLSNDNFDVNLKNLNKRKCTIVYCYKGNSSQAAAHYLTGQGFEEVYSLDGGYDAWAPSVALPHDHDH